MSMVAWPLHASRPEAPGNVGPSSHSAAASSAMQDDHMTVCDALRKAAARRLGCSKDLPAEAIHLVRKSFDSRRDKR